MSELFEIARTALTRFDLRNLVDILVVAAIAYGLLTLIQGTTGIALLRGIVVVFLVGSLASSWFGLTVLGWLLRNVLPALLIAIPIVFQPELRRAFEHVGRAQRLILWGAGTAVNQRGVAVVSAAAADLSHRGWGALIVLERETLLGEYTASGTRIDADLSVELLVSLFAPRSPLHDGAVVVRGDRIVAAGCVLPLPETVDDQLRPAAVRGGAPRELGMRHRAGIGITEKTDALSVIVSEETGRISLANNGRVVGDLDDDRLRRILNMLYKPGPLETGTSFVRSRVSNRQP
ncbi:MAG: TIGR00159 family protein [Chloroflexi bacterium]|nr:TIGR00159 family protein [Chloroflexota bacterium]